MTEIQKINIEDIASKSDVNSRTIEVEVGLEGLEGSMQKDGFWSNKPILIRPNEKEGFKYEIVEGQRRLLAARKVGIKEIPAVVEELNDLEALSRSFRENEESKSLDYKDKSKFSITLWNKFADWKRAADFSGYSVQRLRKWARSVGLPEKVKNMVGKGDISEKNAMEILDHTSSDEDMRERAEFMVGKSKDVRNLIIQFMKNLGPRAKIEEIKKKVEAEPLPIRLSFEFTGGFAEAIRKASEERGDIGKKALVRSLLYEGLKRDKYL